MTFLRPVKGGDVITFESRIILAGRTSLHAHILMRAKGEFVMEGFITFVHVDREGRARPHGIEITTVTEADQVLLKQLKALLGQKPA
jgi:acyl-CoA hydrolase